MAEEDGHDQGSSRGNVVFQLVVLAVLCVVLFFAALCLYGFIYEDEAGEGALPFALCAMLTVPHLVLFYSAGTSALRSDLSDDDVLRAQVRRVRRFCVWGLVLVALASLALAAPMAALHFNADMFQYRLEAIRKLDLERQGYDTTHGEGAYERDLAASGMGRDEFDAEQFGADRFRLAQEVVNPLALGGELFWGMMGCLGLVLALLELGAASLVADSVPERPGGGGVPGKALPEDVAQILGRAGNTPGVHLRSRGDGPGANVVDSRAEAVALLLKSVALTRVRQGCVLLGVFFAWAVLALVGVGFGLVS